MDIRVTRLKITNNSVRGVCDCNGIAVGLAGHRDEHRGAVFARRTNVVFVNSQFDSGDVAHIHRLPGDICDGKRGQLIRILQTSGDDSQHGAMRVGHTAGRGRQIRPGETGDNIVGPEPMLQHPRRIEPHEVFTIFAADGIDAKYTGNPMQRGHQVVSRDIADLVQALGRVSSS